MIPSKTKAGTQRGGRAEPDALLQVHREGDILVAARVDRLAPSLNDLQDIVHELKGRGVALRATERLIDDSTAAGKALRRMLIALAALETDPRRERQMEEIAAARERRVYKGRIDPGEIRLLNAGEGIGATALSHRLGIARSSMGRSLPGAEPIRPVQDA